MTPTALVVLAAAALVVIVVLGVRARRTSRATRAQFARGLLELGERLDSLARELADSVEKVRSDAVRTRIVESFGGTLDLDEVLARCAEAADALPGVSAAAVAVEIDGMPLVAPVGVDPEQFGAVTGPPGRTPVRAVGLSYHYAEGRRDAGAMRSAVAVPIESEGVRVGFLTVFGTGEEPPVSGGEFQTLEAIAHYAGHAIDRARRHAARHAPQPDALTGLGGRQLLHETLALEVARAHRSGRRLAVCLLDVDDLGRGKEALGATAIDALLARIADQLRETIRPGDLVYRCGGDEFAVVLPDSGRIDAEATFARVQASLHRLPEASSTSPSLSAGIAELKPDDDGVSLFERAERALRRAKDAGKGTAA